MSKVVKLGKGPASAYAAVNEEIREFSDGRGNGGLLSLRKMDPDADVKGIVIDVYRTYGLVTVNVSKPESALDTWLPNGLTVEILADHELYAVISAANAEIERRQSILLIDALRRAVAEELEVEAIQHGDAVSVQFLTIEYDNGLFFDPGAPTVTWTDGTTSEWAVAAGLAEITDLLAEFDGTCGLKGADATLTVTLANGAVDYDENGD